MTLTKKSAPWILCVALFLHVTTSTHLFGQESEYLIHISDIQRTIHKNWIGIPKSVDCTVKWDVYAREEGDWRPRDISTFEAYRIRYGEPSIPTSMITPTVDGNIYTIQDLKVGKNFAFVVEAMNGGMVEIASDTASVLTGKAIKATGGPPTIAKWYYFIPFNGRIPMSIIGRSYVFDTATKAGQIAFHIIWNFFILGLIIVISCIRHLRLAKVFPCDGAIPIIRGFDANYDKNVSKEFLAVMDEWKILVESANEHVRDELENGNQNSVEEIEIENVRFWRKRGAEAIRNLKSRLRKLGPNATIRIMQAGLENHELGGFRWLEASKEVDRAIESRASSEMEYLRRMSKMDWLWNLGTLAPLVGLFGTATGISFAFATLSMLRTNVTQAIIVNRLAGGIFEALWTTIEGLFVGIILMIGYYYYQNKLNWIYSKWEEIYVQISEKL